MTTAIHIPFKLRDLDFLTEYEKEWLSRYTDYFSLGELSKDADGCICCTGTLSLNKDVSVINGIKFGTVDNFSFHVDSPITSLKNGPHTVVNEICLAQLPSLTTLEGFPRTAKRVVINKCASLTSLEGVCERVDRFDLERCPKITSLKGMPKYIDKQPMITIREVPIASFSNIHEIIYEFGVKTTFVFYAPKGNTQNLITPLLGFLMIKNVERIHFFDYPTDSGIVEAAWALYPFFKTEDPSYYIDVCHERMCQNGLSQYAKI